MSAAQPYLHKVRKSQLLEFAELTDLNGYVIYYHLFACLPACLPD